MYHRRDKKKERDHLSPCNMMKSRDNDYEQTCDDGGCAVDGTGRLICPTTNSSSCGSSSCSSSSSRSDEEESSFLDPNNIAKRNDNQANTNAEDGKRKDANDVSGHRHHLAGTEKQEEEKLHSRRTLYLFRHGEALHNVLEKKAQQRAEQDARKIPGLYSEEEISERIEMARKAVLIDPELRDAELTDYGREQAHTAARNLRNAIRGSSYGSDRYDDDDGGGGNDGNGGNIRSNATGGKIHPPTEVMVSPLSRCLETCKILISDCSEIIKVSIRPEITERKTMLPPDTPHNTKLPMILSRSSKVDNRFTVSSSLRSLDFTDDDDPNNIDQQKSSPSLRNTAISTSIDYNNYFSNNSSDNHKIENTNMKVETIQEDGDGDGADDNDNDTDTDNSNENGNENENGDEKKMKEGKKQQHTNKITGTTTTTKRVADDSAGAGAGPGDEDGVESKEMLRERASEMFDLLIDKMDHRHVMIVSHKGYLRELERGLLNMPNSPLFDNCEMRIYRVVFTQRSRQLRSLERLA